VLITTKRFLPSTTSWAMNLKVHDLTRKLESTWSSGRDTHCGRLQKSRQNIHKDVPHVVQDFWTNRSKNSSFTDPQQPSSPHRSSSQQHAQDSSHSQVQDFQQPAADSQGQRQPRNSKRHRQAPQRFGSYSCWSRMLGAWTMNKYIFFSRNRH